MPQQNKIDKPLGLRIISLLSFICGALGAVVGIALIFLGIAFLGSNAPNASGAPIISIIGVVVFIIGLLLLFLGHGIDTRKKWAWTLGMLLGGFGFILNLNGIISNSSSYPKSLTASFVIESLIIIIISLVVMIYLIRKNVRDYFGQKTYEESLLTKFLPHIFVFGGIVFIINTIVYFILLVRLNLIPNNVVIGISIVVSLLSFIAAYIFWKNKKKLQK